MPAIEMYELLSVGLVILLGILGGKLSHRYKIPRVTGYMLTGLLFGPSVLGLISSSTLESIHMINDIALGLILFTIGGEIDLHKLRTSARKMISVTLAESSGSMILVFLAVWAITQDVGLALLLGGVSIATAPGVTLLVTREYRARGPLTESLLAVVALNNVLCLLGFRLFFAFYSMTEGTELITIVATLGKELIGAAVFGLAIGAMITYWEQKIDDLSELLLVIIGGILAGIGLAKTMGISYMIVCLVIGAVTNNLSAVHRLIHAELRQTEMPFYIAFFVLSGASLHIDSLAHLGIIGAAYMIVRPIGKYIGARWSCSKLGVETSVKENLGMALLPQAGVAIGMVIAVSETHPELGAVMSTVILSSVIVYEGIGPFLTRLSLKRAGEIHLQE